MATSLDAVFYIDKPPTVTFQDGLFRICFEVGARAKFELVMSPHTFLKTRRLSERAIEQFEAGDDKVLRFGKH